MKKKAVKRANAKIYKQYTKETQDRPESDRLRFSDETAPPAERSADKNQKNPEMSFENSDGKLYERKKSGGERSETRAVKKSQKDIIKKKSHYKFTEDKRMHGSKLRHAIETPGREVGVLLHREVKKSDNSGVEAAHSTERASVFVADKAIHSAKSLNFKPDRSVFRTDEKAARSKALRDRGKREKSKRGRSVTKKGKPVKKAKMKRMYKKRYATQLRLKDIKKFHRIRMAYRAIKLIVKYIASRVVAFRYVIRGMIIGFLLVFVTVVAVNALMAAFGASGFNTILLTSYTAEEEDILGADADYDAMGAALAARISNIENEFPGYDEYHYYLDDIGHDPYTLASYLTAKYFAYTRAQVQADLVMLFSEQYELTTKSVVEIRTRVEVQTEIIIIIDPDTDEEVEIETQTEVEVEYEYYILEVTLKNKSLGMIVVNHLSPEELEMFRVYQETRGNRTELFENHPYANRGEYLKYDVPPEALADEQFAAILREAEKYLGYPYVWGGSSPSTSFDCSGFVSWVINNSGWNVGRLGALGLFNITTPVAPSNAKPGDLIFFNYTYNAPQPHLPTHVGIYVGNGMMIHCGNPISYANITSNYWTKHFYAFGRLP